MSLHSDELQVGPHFLEQVIKVPLVVSRHGNGVRDLVDDVELLDRDLIDLVETVDARYVDSVAFDDVDQVVDSGVASVQDVGVVYLVFVEDGIDRVQVELTVGRLKKNKSRVD